MGKIALFLSSSVIAAACGGSTSDSDTSAPVNPIPDASADAVEDVQSQGACAPCVPDEMTCTQTFSDGSQAESTTWTIVERTETGCTWKQQWMQSFYTLNCATLQICVPTGECFQATYESDGGAWGTLSTGGPDKCYVKTF